MKLSQLKSIVKDAVKEAIQEEMKDILIEAVRAPKSVVYENSIGTPNTNIGTPSPMNPVAQQPMPNHIKVCILNIHVHIRIQECHVHMYISIHIRIHMHTHMYIRLAYPVN